MSTPRGRFVWYELTTTDVPAAQAFYNEVIGWSARDAGMEQPYVLFTLGSGDAAPMIGGLMETPPEAKANGAPPCWTGYITVDDVDGDARHFEEAGGRTFVPPMDIPGIGRFSIVTDPQGAALALFKPLAGDPPQAPAMGTPGTVGWHELYASDLDKAITFYSSMFGWALDEAHDMGPLGKYQTFRSAEDQAGGMVTRPEGRPVSWGYYFNIEDIDAAVGRVAAQGGQLMHGPIQVPGGTWIANCRDPQGAMFSLAGPRKDAQA